MHLSSKESLSKNTESGMSFKSKTCEVGVFSICTLLHGFGRGSESAVKEEGDSADEGSRDIQVLEAEQKPMMSLSCQNLVTGNSNALGVLELSWLVRCSGRRVGAGCVSLAVSFPYIAVQIPRLLLLSVSFMAQYVENAYVHVGSGPFKDFLELLINLFHAGRGTPIV